MIGELLTDLGGRVGHADVVATTDDTLSFTRSADGSTLLAESERTSLQVRLVDQGRVGWAGGRTTDRESIVAAAFRSLEASGPTPFFPPSPAALPAVATHSPDSDRLGPADLVSAVADLVSRIEGPGRRVEGWAERSKGAVTVGNTRGVSAEYRVTLSGIGATVRLDDGPAALALDTIRNAPIDAAAIDDLAAEFATMLRPPVLEFQSLPAAMPVWFGPRAVKELLSPVLARLLGERWILGRADPRPIDERVTLVDDPLAPLRPGSRPIDDDGVPTRSLTLIDRGRPIGGLVDLRLGSRHHRPSTGHSYRRGYAAPRVGFSNVVMAEGPSDRGALAAAANDGLYLPVLRFGPAPNPEAGVFKVAAPWAYRLAGGEIVGRLEGVWLAGEVFELLGRLTAVGNDPTWLGAVRVPSLVVDGVAVTAR